MLSSHNKQQSLVHALKKILNSLDKHLFGVMDNKRYQSMFTLLGVVYIGFGIVFLADFKTFVHAQTSDMGSSSDMNTQSHSSAYNTGAFSATPAQTMGCGQGK